MQKTQITQNQKGFSLIELMIVVAIIGLLAAIGIPQYAKFQARARQSEVKGSLAALYTAEKGYASEWNGYTVDVFNAGFSVEGNNLRYTTGFVDAAACTALPAGAPAETLTRTQSISTGVATAGTTWLNGVAVSGTPIAVTGGICNLTVFTAIGLGDPRNSPAALADGSSDKWSIDQNKKITSLRLLL